MSMGLPEPAPLAPSGPAVTACWEKGRGKLKSPLGGKGEELCFSCSKCLLRLKHGYILLTVLGEEELMPAITPGETSQLSKVERASKGELQREMRLRALSAGRPQQSDLSAPILMDHSLHVVCSGYQDCQFCLTARMLESGRTAHYIAMPKP